MANYLPRKFFERDPLTCARELIGCEIRWNNRAGIIVETEAYDAQGDEASHTHVRPSTRAFVAAHRAGTAYVYFNYGVHWMLNVLVKGEREGFVLIRALEPVSGLEHMYAARNVESIHQLCSGPGKLAKALGVTGADHGRDLCHEAKFAFYPPKVSLPVVTGPRIGISKAVKLPWRFHAQDNLHVSGRVGTKTRPAGPKPDRS
jgi:DNA-3-methyladenine glycosylase